MNRRDRSIGRVESSSMNLTSNGWVDSSLFASFKKPLKKMLKFINLHINYICNKYVNQAKHSRGNEWQVTM